MNEYDVRRFILALAIQARIDGMKAFNDRRTETGSVGYDQPEFDAMANQLEELAYKHDEQL